MGEPTIRTKKQQIRLWFEFYKLCLDDPDLQENLKKSEEYYRPWGDVRGVDFHKWWYDHHFLFGGFRVKEISKAQSYPNVLNVAIPLDQPLSNSIKYLKTLIEEKQKQRLEDQGYDTSKLKSYAPTYGDYAFTQGVEIRGRKLYEIQLFYSLWVEMGRPAINTAFIESLKIWFANRPRAKWKPSLFVYEPNEQDKHGNPQYSNDVISMYRRYIRKGKQVCKDVSLGRFPGKSVLK